MGSLAANPTAAVSVSRGADPVPWVNPGNVYTENGSSATADTDIVLGPFGGETQFLRCTGFDFSTIPSYATIVGMVMRFKCAREQITENIADLMDYSIRLLVGGTETGDDNAIITNWPITSLDWRTGYGGVDDTWGISLTPAILQASDFGVSIVAEGFGSSYLSSDTRAVVDVVELTAYYTVPEADAEGGADWQSRAGASSQSMGGGVIKSATSRVSGLSTGLSSVGGGGGGGSSFSPLSIADLAAWYDANDMNTLFQTPTGPEVTADGDPVGYWQDKSGNGRHLSQTTASKRPTFSKAATIIGGYLLNGNFETLDGINDFANWTESVSGTSTVTSDTGYTGTYSCKLTGDSSNSFVAIQQAGFAVGRTYRYGFWAKSDVAGRSLYVYFNATSINVTLTTDWAYYSGTITADGTTFGIKRNTLTSASAWIDDVVLERVQGVVFDGSDDWIVTTLNLGQNDKQRTFFVGALQKDSAIWWNANGGWTWKFNLDAASSNKPGIRSWGGSNVIGATARQPFSHNILEAAAISGGTGKILFDGTEDVSSAGMGGGTASSLELMASQSGTQNQSGQVCELVYFHKPSGDMTADDATAVRNYLKNKWGTP